MVQSWRQLAGPARDILMTSCISKLAPLFRPSGAPFSRPHLHVYIFASAPPRRSRAAISRPCSLPNAFTAGCICVPTLPSPASAHDTHPLIARRRASILFAQARHGPAVRVMRPAAVVVVRSGPAKPRPRFTHTQQQQRQSCDVTAGNGQAYAGCEPKLRKTLYCLNVDY